MMKFSKQKGLSSVEMVMILPMFLFFFVLMANVGQFWHVKLDNQINARTEAWRHAMFGSLADSFCESSEVVADELRTLAEVDALDRLYQEKVFRDATNLALTPPVSHALACKGNLKNNTNYRGSSVISVTQSDRNLNSKSRRYRSGFVAELNKTADQPYAVTGRAYYLYAQWKFKDKHVFLLEDYHVLDVNGSYQQVDLPYGHDDYLLKYLIRD